MLQLVSKAARLLLQWLGHSHSGQEPQEQAAAHPCFVRPSKSLLQDMCGESWVELGTRFRHEFTEARGLYPTALSPRGKEVSCPQAP